jgi:hypothetical protein
MGVRREQAPWISAGLLIGGPDASRRSRPRGGQEIPEPKPGRKREDYHKHREKIGEPSELTVRA